MHLTPYGNLVIGLALVGAATLITLILRMTEPVIGFLLASTRTFLSRRQNHWNRPRALRHLPPMNQAEREAVAKGMQEALDAFKRAELAAHGKA